jgi:hypothetical protein
MRWARSLPWPLCAVRGDEDPAASKQVEAAVGDVVEDGVSHGGLESGENSGQGQRRGYGWICSNIVIARVGSMT